MAHSKRPFDQSYQSAAQESHAANFPFPDVKSFGPSRKGYGDPQFEEAKVMEPKKGYYQDPIARLEFPSLYSLIIMAHNLCYSKLVKPEHLCHIGRESVSLSASGALFVKKSVKTGILTVILEELFAARKQTKRDLKAAKDPFLKCVLDRRQLALQISSNAVYAFTGASLGKLPCMAISVSTAAYRGHKAAK